MTSSSTAHYASSLQDNHSDGHDARITRRDEPDSFLYSARQWISSEAPTRWTYFLLGCTILLPWNALVSGTPFFLSRLVDSPFYSTFSSYMSSVFTLTKLFFLFYCTITAKQSSPSRRIFASVITTILLITSLFLSTFVRDAPSTFFSFALFSTASLAIASSYLCAAVYAMAAVLGPSFLQSVLSGQAAIAVVISAVQVVSAVISVWGLFAIPTAAMEIMGTNDTVEETATSIFFGVSVAFLVVTLVAYTWLARQASYKWVIDTMKGCNNVEDTDELIGLVTGNRQRPSSEGILHVYQILCQNRTIFFSIAYVYTVTLAIHPAITVRVQSVNPYFPALLFTTIQFLVFNIGDLVGRHLFLPSLLWSPSKILIVSVLRTLFIPLILLCNIHPQASPVISSDTLVMIILFIMGYTNGFVACVATLVASSPVYNPRLGDRRQDVDVTAALCGTFMMVGLACGSLASFCVEALI